MSKGEQTRQMILEKAAVAFNHKGYHAGSLSDLMKSTGLEKGGIYNHFGSKDDLAIASLEYIVDEFRLAIAEVIRGPRRAVARVDVTHGVFRRVARGLPVPGGCPIMSTAIGADFAHPHLSEIARKAFDEC